MFIKVTALDEVEENKRNITYINPEYITSIKWNQDIPATEILLAVGALLDVIETPDEILAMIRKQKNTKE